MNLRGDAETIGAALVSIAPVVYASFEDKRAIGITDGAALYIVLQAMDFQYDNDSPGYVDVLGRYTIDVYVRGAANGDVESRCLDLVSSCISALPNIHIRGGYVLAKTVTRQDTETQSTCRYRIEAETEITEVI